jgi:GH25 family lysozyme M1 (1,4-beta-N-acetylmuramidase)
VNLIADLSHWQGSAVRIYALKQAGVAGVYHAIGDGAYLDPAFGERRAEAARIGLPFGGYYFARTATQPAHAAGFVAAIVGKLGRREFRVALDMENPNPAHDAALWARAFNREIVRLLGVMPLFYSNPDFITRAQPSYPIGAGLWLAAYNRDDGTDHPFMVPKPWKRAVLHQFTSRGHVAGVGEGIDLSHGPSMRPLWAHPGLNLL